MAYQNYQDVLDKSQKEATMSVSEKSRLKRDIETLESMDHVEILRIIRESMTDKPYTVSNRQTMLDLDDLSHRCLWKISYYVNFCLENQRRDQDKFSAEKQHLAQLKEVEDNIKRQSKLKLSPTTFLTDEFDESQIEEPSEIEDEDESDE